MNLLAIDTSFNATVLGIQVGEQRHIFTTQSPGSHSREILPNVDNLLAQAGLPLSDLDAIVFGRGPGSFTGLRIAVGVVQGLGYGLKTPVIPVSTLACLAAGEFRRSGAMNIYVALTARKEEVFLGAYNIVNKLPVLYGSEAVLDCSLAPRLGSPADELSWVGIGEGWQFREKLEKAIGVKMAGIMTEPVIQAHDLLDIGTDKMNRGETIDAMNAEPEYLREQVASVPGTSAPK